MKKKIIEAAVLQFIPDPKCHGMIKGGILFKTGSGLEPELYSKDVTKVWLLQSIHGTYEDLTLDMFKLVNVEIHYGTDKKE